MTIMTMMTVMTMMTNDHLDVDEPALVAADVLPAAAPLGGPRGQPHVLAGLHLVAAQHGHNTAALRPLEL